MSSNPPSGSGKGMSVRVVPTGYLGVLWLNVSFDAVLPAREDVLFYISHRVSRDHSSDQLKACTNNGSVGMGFISVHMRVSP